jgi:hypothetical protein
MSPHPGRWRHRLDEGRIQCNLYPGDCRLHDGQRGMRFVRQRVGEAMARTTYGLSSGFCIDPIEKKPLNHFHSGSNAYTTDSANQPLLENASDHPSLPAAWRDYLRRRLWAPDACYAP